MRSIWKIGLQWAGWKTDVVFPHHGLDKFIILVAPHTSAWDFVVGVAYRYLLRLERVGFLGKQELFKPPFGFIFRSLGGIPVERHKNQHQVDEVVKLFQSKDRCFIALSPEGTRKKVDKLKSGFYHIARQAKVPIILVGLDYKHRTVRISDAFYIGDDTEEDYNKIIGFFRPIQGKYPELGMGHL